jgi:hypothetical protein
MSNLSPTLQSHFKLYDQSSPSKRPTITVETVDTVPPRKNNVKSPPSKNAIPRLVLSRSKNIDPHTPASLNGAAEKLLLRPRLSENNNNIGRSGTPSSIKSLRSATPRNSAPSTRSSTPRQYELEYSENINPSHPGHHGDYEDFMPDPQSDKAIRAQNRAINREILEHTPVERRPVGRPPKKNSISTPALDAARRPVGRPRVPLTDRGRQESSLRPVSRAPRRSRSSSNERPNSPTSTCTSPTYSTAGSDNESQGSVGGTSDVENDHEIISNIRSLRTKYFISPQKRRHPPGTESAKPRKKSTLRARNCAFCGTIIGHFKPGPGGDTLCNYCGIKYNRGRFTFLQDDEPTTCARLTSYKDWHQSRHPDPLKFTHEQKARFLKTHLANIDGY